MPKLRTQSAEPKTAGDLQSSNTKAQLFAYVERFERLQEEKESLAADQREVMDEAKGMGFDTAILRKVIARRKLDTATRDENDEILALYESVIAQAEKTARMQSENDGE